MSFPHDEVTEIKFSRDRLYAEVWSKPMVHLAKRYGVSGSALKSICNELGVPTPRAGYWSKLSHGKADPQPPLPPSDGRTEIIRRVLCRPVADSGQQKPEPSVATDTDAVSSRAQIHVQQTLVNPHPLVARALAMLKAAKPDADGLLHSGGQAARIIVGPASVERALRIMDAVLKALETRNYRVETDEYTYCKMASVEIDGQKIGFYVREKLNQFENEQRGSRDKSGLWLDTRRWRHEPSGQLRLYVVTKRGFGPRAVLSDGKRMNIERRLHHFVARLEREAKESALQEERYRQAAYDFREAEERRREEEQRIKSLEDQLMRWEKSQRIRAFLSAAKEAALRRHGRIDAGSPFDKWWNWAQGYADRLDPLGAFNRGSDRGQRSDDAHEGERNLG